MPAAGGRRHSLGLHRPAVLVHRAPARAAGCRLVLPWKQPATLFRALLGVGSEPNSTTAPATGTIETPLQKRGPHGKDQTSLRQDSLRADTRQIRRNRQTGDSP